MLFVVTISSDTETLLLNSLDLTLHRAGCIITCLTEVHKGRRKVIAMVTEDSYWNCATPLTLRPLNTKAAEKSQRVFAPLTPRLHALRQFRSHEFPVCGIVVFFSVNNWLTKEMTYLSSSHLPGSLSLYTIFFKIRLKWRGNQQRAKITTKQKTVFATSRR